MDDKPRRQINSIDGFVPRPTQYRQVGFGSSQQMAGRMRGVPERRPGYRPQAPMQGISDFRPRPTYTRMPGDNHDTLPAPQTLGQRQAHQQGHAKPKKGLRRISWRKVMKRTSLAFAVLVILFFGWFGWKLFRDSSKVFGGSSNLLGFLSATKLKCENRGRCNILLAGNSADDPGHDGANLTDSIMLISVNTKNNTAFMLSIPRDLYVNIPNNGYAKINEAYPDGQSENFNQPGYPKGGMGLLEETVAQHFHIPIDYYTLIDYSALRDAVNTVGGISIDIQSSDPRGLYDPSIDYKTGGPLVKLTNGWHTLNGEQALDLARARGDSYGSYGYANSDFTRTQDQREMILALKDKVASSSVLANPVKLGQLFDTIGNNVHTDLSAGNIRRLYDLSKQITGSNIKSYGLNSVTLSGQKNVDLLQSYTTSTGEDALVPAAGMNDFSQIQLYLQQIMTNNPITKEAANVVVLNAGNTNGLAGAEKNVLMAKGMDVSTTGDAPAQQASNLIIDNSQGKDPATLAALKQLFGSNTTTSNALTGTYPNAAFIVILGQNQPMPQSQ